MIVIITFNNAELLQLQIDLFMRFVEQDISVVDNSSNYETAKKIKIICDFNHIEYVKTEFNEGDSSRSHGLACGFAYKWFKNQCAVLTLADHDVFPFRPFKFNPDVIWAIPQIRAHLTYPWVGLIAIKTILKEITFMPCRVQGINLDTGGELCYLSFEHLEERYETTNGLTYSIIEDSFMHLQNLSNWKSEENHGERIGNLITILNQKVSENA